MPDPKKPEADEGGTDDEKKYVTIDDVRTFLDKTLKKHDEVLVARFDGGLAELKQLLTARSTEPEPKPAEPANEKPAPVEDSPAYRSLKRQLEETNARVKAAEDARAVEAAKATDMRLRTQLAEALSTAGVDPKYVRHAVGFLVDAEKRVRAGEDGAIVFRDGTDDVDLTTGLKSWIRGDEAKLYLAPRGANGSGDKATGKAPAKSGQPSREELAVKFQEALMGGVIGVG